MLPRFLPRRLGIALAAALAIYAAATSHQSIHWLSAHGRPQRSEDWRSAVAYLNKNTDDAPILLRSGLIEADALRTDPDQRLADYCRFPLTSLYPVDRPASEIHPLTMTAAGRLTEPLRQTLQPTRSHPTEVWLVVRGDAARANGIVRELRATFAAQRTSVIIVSEHPFGRVQVLRLRLSIADRPAR